MANETYNGWHNYETWRVNLEMFDGMAQWFGRERDLYTLMNVLKEHAENEMEGQAKGLALDYAMAFLSEVNWREIATHMMAEMQEAEEHENT